MPGACNYSPQFISCRHNNSIPLSSPKKYTYFPLDITEYHLPRKCVLSLRAELPKTLLSSCYKPAFCGEHKLQNRMFLITSRTPPAHSQFSLISLFLSELWKKKVALVERSVVFGHFHNRGAFWRMEAHVEEVVFNALHLSSAHFNTSQVAFYFKDSCTRYCSLLKLLY